MQTRKTHPEVIRVIATFFVVLGHTGISGYLYYMRLESVVPRLLFMGFTSFIQAATVPLYAMISGALLLPRHEDIRTVLRKRVFRFALLLTIFSLVSYLYTALRNHQTVSPWVFICNLYSYEQVYSYWYLYAYLAFLVVLPFMRILAERMSEMEYRYFFGVALIYYLLSPFAFLFLKEPLSPSSNFLPFVVQTLVFFPLSGHYIENRLDDDVFTRKNVCIALLLSLVAIIFEVIVQHLYERRFAGQEISPDLYLSCLNMVPGMGFYFAVKALYLRRSIKPRIMRVLQFFSSMSFGVFLLHHIYLVETAPIGQFLKSHLGIFPGTLVWVLFMCLMGTGITWLIKLIPGMKKLF